MIKKNFQIKDIMLLAKKTRKLVKRKRKNIITVQKEKRNENTRELFIKTTC